MYIHICVGILKHYHQNNDSSFCHSKFNNGISSYDMYESQNQYVICLRIFVHMYTSMPIYGHVKRYYNKPLLNVSLAESIRMKMNLYKTRNKSSSH